MNITRPSATSLRIRIVPWSLWIIGALFAAAGLFMLYGGVGQTSNLACTRVEPTQINCALHWSLFGVPTSTTTINNVQGAKLAVSHGSKRNTYRVEILTRNGVVPMTSFYSSYSSSMQSTVDRVNSMVRDPNMPTLSVNDYGVWGLLFVLLFIGIGVILSPLFWGPVVTWTFDTLLGTLVVQSFRGFSKRVTSYNLSDIRSASVQISTSSKGSSTSRVALRLRSGEEVPLTSYYSGGSRAKNEAVVDSIQHLLNLDPMPDPIDEVAPMYEQAVQLYGRSLFGDRSAAAAAMRQVIDHDPNHQQAWLLLGASVADPAEQRRCYERAIAINPTSHDGRAAATQLARLDPAASLATQPAVSGAAAFASPVAAQAMAGVASNSAGGIFARILGVALLQRPVYRAIAEDPSLTAPAGLIVVAVAALVGCFHGLTSTSLTVNGSSLPPGLIHAAASMTAYVLSSVIGWFVGSAVFAGVAAMLRGKTNIGEMARVLGFVSVFNLLWIVPIGFIPAFILLVRGTMMSVGEAAEFNTPRVIVTALVSWAITFAVIGVAMLILNLVLVGSLAAAFGVRV